MDLGEISKVVKDEYQKLTKQNKYLKEYTLKNRQQQQQQQQQTDRKLFKAQTKKI